MSISSSTNELQTVPSSSLDDLDLEHFDAFLREHIPRLASDDIPHEDALVRLRLASTMGNRFVPTYAGIYLFGREPQWLLPQLSVVAACFEGDRITDEVSTRVHFEGSLPELHEQVIEFVEAHAQAVINQVAPEKSALEFPRRAVREAVTNALVHRELRTGGPVSIRIFKSRFEVFNPGPPNALPQSIQHYTKSPGTSLPRNPLVAAMARHMGLVEQLGRGLAVMERVVAEEGGELEVVGDKEGVTVRIPSTLVAQARRAGQELTN